MRHTQHLRQRLRPLRVAHDVAALLQHDVKELRLAAQRGGIGEVAGQRGQHRIVFHVGLQRAIGVGMEIRARLEADQVAQLAQHGLDGFGPAAV